MREVEFRAWDKRKKEMRTDFSMCPTVPTWSATINHAEEEINTLINEYYKKKGDILVAIIH